ncbi:MAG: hypothetical protein JWP87_720 [Labilithrix sp.]|nr:hypothetical protein [Labilithrix sp.]
MVPSPAVDGSPPADVVEVRQAAPPGVPAYAYAATDYRPRQPREIALCEKASSFDWLYTATFAALVAGSEYLSIGVLKQSETPGVRLIGPGLVGFSWGGFLSGGYLSLPKCDPLWAEGPPPEGNVRATWPMAAAITLVAAATAPAMDYVFLGAVPVHWPVPERSARVFIAMGTGILGSLFPYVVSPKTWAAKKEIERIRLGEVAGGPFVSYGFAF